MMRIILSILIVVLFTGVGLIKADSYRLRRSELERVLETIKLLEMEINYRREPLINTFNRLWQMKNCWLTCTLKNCSEEMKEYRTLKQCWDNSLIKYEERCPLSSEDLEILEDLVIALGRSDARGQCNIIKSSHLRLKNNYDKACRIEETKGRMYRSLGIGCGIITAILII